MRYLLASFSIVLLLIPFLFGFDEANAATWYNSSWLKARKITIDQTDIDTADLTNYPLYVNMTSVNIGTDAQADCDDFVFTDSTNVTKLDHEIETCDSTADWAEFWVEIPTVSNTVDTIIYMYYNNAAAVDQQNTQATWNSNFAAVWHLNGTFIDSTSSPITCTNSGSSASTDKYIGDARSWDGIDDFLYCGSATKIDDIWTTGGTLSFWVNPVSVGEGGTFSRPLDKSSAASALGWRLGFVTPTGNVFRYNLVVEAATDGQWRTGDQMTLNKFQLVTITYDKDSDANDPLFYINGTSTTVTQQTNPVTISSDNTLDLCLGNAASAGTCGATATLDGVADEFRLVDKILTPEWIKADWECQKGATQNSIGPAVSCITVGSQGVQNSIVTVSDEFALEDSGSVIGMGIVTVSDEYALEDSVSIIPPQTVQVSDEFALEDSAGTNQITVSDEYALEDSVSNSAKSPTRNAIAIYVNKSPFTFGIFSDATRMTCSATIKGGVIFNTNDLNLNICTGVTWILPNGTAT